MSDDPLAPIPDVPGIGETLFVGLTKANAAFGGGISLCLGFLAKHVADTSTIPLWVAVVVGFVLAWIIFGCLRAVHEAVKTGRSFRDRAMTERGRFEQERERLLRYQAKPVVCAATRPFHPYTGATCVLIVEWPAAASLPMGAPVIISIAESTHERPLGTGTVRPPQQDGKSVITLDRPNEGIETIIDSLLGGASHDDAVKRLRVGPGYELQNLQQRVPGVDTSQAALPGVTVTPAGDSRPAGS